MARTIAVWGPTGLGTPTCKLMLRSALTTVVETITLTEHATVKRLYTGTVTASAGQYRFNLLSAGAFVGGGSIYVGATDETTYEEDNSIDWAHITNPTATVALSATTINNGGVRKNTALANFEFFMVDATDHLSGKTGLTVTATRSIDGAAFASCANSVSEVSNGVYKISLAAADLNGDVVTLRFTASGADPRLITIRTTP